MEFGIFARFDTRDGCTQADAFDEWMDIAYLADDIGIDCYWLGEFHFRPRTISSSPVVIASAIAARTKRMKVGLAVQLLPLANPLRLAEETATLDHLSKGRFVYGIGRSSFIDSYQGYGVDYDESRERFDEALEVIRRAWGEEPFSYSGHYYNYANVNLVPKPYQQPHPPVRIACESRETFALMGKLGFPILIRHQLDVSELQRLLKEYEDARHANGFPGPNEVTLQATVYVAESRERALADTEPGILRERALARETARNIGDDEGYERLTRIQKISVEEQVQGPGLGAYPNPLIFGTPEEVVDRLQEYEDTMGITGVSMTINPGLIPNERIVNSLRLMADKVIPKLK